MDRSAVVYYFFGDYLLELSLFLKSGFEVEVGDEFEAGLPELSSH